MGLKLVWTKKPDFFLLEDRKRIEFREEAGDNLHLQQFLKEVEVAFSGGYGDRHTMLNVQFLRPKILKTVFKHVRTSHFAYFEDF